MTPLLTADEAARLVPGEQLVIVRPGGHPDWCSGNRHWSECECWGTPSVAAPDWVALTGPCPNIECGDLRVPFCSTCGRKDKGSRGRRIVPLYTECRMHGGDCRANPDGSGTVRVGRGSIEVVPVVDVGGVLAVTGDHIYVRGGVALLMTNGPDWGERTLTLDPLPVPGRDFGVVIDYTEVAS